MKRGLRRAAALIAAAVLSAIPFRFSAAMRNPAAAAAVQIPGIDVSKFQEEIDWSTVAASGERFAIIRCCKIVHATGQKEFDERFEENYHNARDAGIAVGCYMYTDAATESEFSQDVSFLLSHIEGKSFDFPVYLDLESASRQEHLPPSVFMPPLLAALTQIEDAGHTAGIYANTAFFSECLSRDMLRNSGFHIWEANYFNTVDGLYSPAGHDLSAGASVWQYSGCGRVRGIRTIVDRSVCYTADYFSHTVTLSEDALLPFGILEQGSPFAVSGTVSADYVIRSVTGTVFHAKTDRPTDLSVTLTPNAKQVDLSGEFSRQIVFSSLSEGEYKLRITAVDSSGITFTLCEAPFTVYKSAMYEPGKRAAQVAVDHAISEAGSTGTTTTTTATTTTTTTTAAPTTPAPVTETFSETRETAANAPDGNSGTPAASERPEPTTRIRLRWLTDLAESAKIQQILQFGADLCRKLSWDSKSEQITRARADAEECIRTAHIILNARH